MKLGQVGSKNRLLDEIVEKLCVHSRGHSFNPKVMKLGHYGPLVIFIYNKNNDKQRHTTFKIAKKQKQKSCLGTASNKIADGGRGGGGAGELQLVCGRPTLALSSALILQTLSCSVCVEDS